jgi:hypothetical protein
MERFAERAIRGSNVLHGIVAVVILVATAANGYWAVFFPFLLVLGIWVC